MIFYLFLLVTIIIWCLFAVISAAINIKKYQHYKTTFRELCNGTYSIDYVDRSERSEGIFSSYTKFEKRPTTNSGDYVIFFTEGDIKLPGERNYIHRCFLIFSDPYTIYWYYRYRNWFLKYGFNMRLTHTKSLEKEENEIKYLRELFNITNN